MVILRKLTRTYAAYLRQSDGNQSPWAVILMMVGAIGMIGSANAQDRAVGARHALVIGNTAYETLPKVGAATGDALTIAGVLEVAGYTVTTTLNADLDDMRGLVGEFSETLTSAGPDASGLIYFAGHAAGIDGQNLLLPVDASGPRADEAVDLDWLMVQLIAVGNAANTVVIDSCHSETGAQGTGLTEMSAPFGIVFAYACQPGPVQSGGDGVFAVALATAVATMPDLIATDFGRLFQQVRQDMFNATNGGQLPWDSLSAGRLLFLETAETVSILEAAPAENAEDRAAAAQWAAVKPTQDPVQVIRFLRQHSNAADSAEARVVFQQLLDADAHQTMPTPPDAGGEATIPSEITFDMPLTGVIPELDGMSLAEIVTQGTPTFAPIEGLPEEVWKNLTCVNCHAWDQDNLCTQGQTYLTETGQAALTKEHPLVGFKQAVRNWAASGCN